MSNIKVVDVNNEEVKQEEHIQEPIEEVKEEEPVQEPIEEVKQEVNEIVKHIPEQPKEDTKPVKAQDKLVRCPKCFKEMKLKSLRYNHQQKCQGTLEQKPVKQFSKPRATPKPKPQPIIEEEIQQHEALSVSNPKPKLIQPQTPNLVDFASHYQLLQNQFMQQKKEKYNNLCQNMFSSKSKKR